MQITQTTIQFPDIQFSVSSSKVEVVKRYIENQKTHHGIETFQEEVEQIVKEYDIIEYDPKYFWD